MNREELSLVYAITCVLGPKMSTPEDQTVFRSVLRDVFPATARPHSGKAQERKELVLALKDHLAQNHLQISEDLISKVPK